MKPEDQQIAMAKLDGWTELYWNESIQRAVGYRPGAVVGNELRVPAPDYLHDLNAVYRMVDSTFLADEYADFSVKLFELHPSACVTVLDQRNPVEDIYYECSHVVNADAALRTKACLMVKGEWVES